MVNIWLFHTASGFRIQPTDLQHMRDEQTNLRKATEDVDHHSPECDHKKPVKSDLFDLVTV